MATMDARTEEYDVPVTTHQVPTSHGTISVTESSPPSGSTNPIIFFIHGNSFSSAIWRDVFRSPAARTYRLMTVDLPGHGDSTNAPNPELSYNQPAYADCCGQVLSRFISGSVIVIGWSLGGHIAIEMMRKYRNVAGIMIIGTPPVGPGELDVGFNFPQGWRHALAARDDLSEAEIDDFAKNCADPPYENWMRDVVARTDGRARELMFEKFDAHLQEHSQREVVETRDRLVAVVNGANDVFINHDFIKSIKYKRLWRNQCIEMEGYAHAPFWKDPQWFETLLQDFASEAHEFGAELGLEKATNNKSDGEDLNLKDSNEGVREQTELLREKKELAGEDDEKMFYVPDSGPSFRVAKSSGAADVAPHNGAGVKATEVKDVTGQTKGMDDSGMDTSS